MGQFITKEKLLRTFSQVLDRIQKTEKKKLNVSLKYLKQVKILT